MNETRTKFARELIVPGVIGNENTQLSSANKDLQLVCTTEVVHRLC